MTMAVQCAPSYTTGGLAESIEEYLVACEARGLSPRTVRGNMRAVIELRFLSWCVEHGISSPRELNKSVLNRWTVAIRQRPGADGPLAESTVRWYLKLVNAYLSWLREEEQVDVRNMRLPRVGRRSIDVLTAEEVRRMVAACRSDRDRAIIWTLWQTGCRVGELLGLRLGDMSIRGGRRMLLVRSWRMGGGSKSAHDRWVPAPDAHRPLRQYVEGSRPTDTDSDRIFLALLRSGRTGRYEPLQRKAVQLMLLDVARRAGIRKRVYPHLFRHSFVTFVHQHGMDVGTIAHIIGDTLDTLFGTYLQSSAEDGYGQLARIFEEGRR